MARKIKIASIQLDCTPMPTEERLKAAAQLLEQARGADIAVFPELFNTGYEYHERN
ncbi:MAG: nitrilase-related carbon-nitrogen hydrolase [Anaerolineae bacterium]